MDATAADPPAHDPTTFEQARSRNVAAFLASGHIGTTGREVTRLSGHASELHARVLACFRRIAADFGATRRDFPVLLPTAVLARTDYFLSFPHQATFATNVADESLGALTDAVRGGHPLFVEGAVKLAPPTRILSPAVCYHCYAELAGAAVTEPLTVLEASGRCFRREAEDACRPLARQREFTMQEIVLLGEAAEVAKARERIRDRVLALAARLGLDGELVAAQDAFYGTPQGKAKGLVQRATGTKQEFVVEAGGGPLAISSFNLHGDYFGRSLEIRAASGAPLSTGCVAFGVERWMRALVAVRGPDPSAWWHLLDEGARVT